VIVILFKIILVVTITRILMITTINYIFDYFLGVFFFVKGSTWRLIFLRQETLL